MIEEFVKKNKIGKLLINENLKKYNTYRVESIASYIVFPKDTNKLIKLIKYLGEHSIKYKILGNGSNLIFVDKVYNGVLIKLDEFDYLDIDDVTITVGAGYNLAKLAIEMTKKGLSGLEFACGIPGSVGGSIYMNAGAYNSDMGYVIESVKILDEKLNIKTIYNKDLKFHYRKSMFQDNKNFIILSAKLILKHGNKQEMIEIMEDRKKRRLMSQPLEYPSAGSVFRNPEIAPSGKLIEDAGLKGKNIGGAMVSLKHANFIINNGGATGKDIYNLINEVKNTVKEKYNVDLKVEQEIVTLE